MNYITSTQLRTDTPKLLSSLLQGKNVDLIHRSQKVATITATVFETNASKEKPFDASSFLARVKQLKLPEVTDCDSAYQQAMDEKHG